MKGDFTRDTFDRTRNFYRVLLQQGRVQVDADGNEQIAILLERLETLIVDVFGPHGGPESACGFAVFHDRAGDIALSRGRYYVEGLLCENREIVKLAPPSHVEADGEETPKAYVVYLDVYERYVSAAQDPSIADLALGGLDTAGRSKICWTAKYWSLAAEGPREGQPAREHWGHQWEQAASEMARLGELRGLLQARTASQLGYTGSQNQLYRVEIHQGGTSSSGNATWKWSRENASVLFAVTDTDSKKQTIELRAGPRVAGAISVGDWVEITIDSDREDDEHKPSLCRVTQIDPSGTPIVLDSSPRQVDQSEHPIVRRWDQQLDVDRNDLGASAGCLPLVENTWLPLEAGIEVFFSEAEGGKARNHYRGGDYWLIPARTATAGIEWPSDTGESDALPPRGVRHRYAPLSGLAVSRNGLRPVHDFRVRRDPLPAS